MLLPHLPDILLSNWQSAVAKVARRPDPDADTLRRPAVDLNNPKIDAATAAANVSSPAGEPADMTGPLRQQALAALNLGKALVSGVTADIASARAEFAPDGPLDPFWSECILEFVEHYTLTKHSDVPYKKYMHISDFVLPQSYLPETCKIAVIGDWGTGAERAQKLLVEVGNAQPDIVIHLGDIYYACTASEANTFYQNVRTVFPGVADDTPIPRVFTLCGNHDMYSGAAPYYALLNKLTQPASFFCLRNKYWQILAGDTGYNDFNPLSRGQDATWIRDFDEGDTYSELAWHRDKLVNAGMRKTIMMTHHQLFTRNASITHRDPTPAEKPINGYLHKQFGDFLGEIVLWLWGHEHNQLVYKAFAGLARGRCVGASSIPLPTKTDLIKVSGKLDGQTVPELVPDARTLQPERAGEFYQLGYAMLNFDGAALQADYMQFDTGTGISTLLYSEPV